MKRYPDKFPLDASGKPGGDHLDVLLNMENDPGLAPEGFSLRDFGAARPVGEGKYLLNRYLRERGDSNIRSVTDLINKARFFDQPTFADSADRKGNLQNMDKEQTLDTSARTHQRFAIQQSVLQCMQVVQVDALTYPTGNVPTPILGQPYEPNLNGRNGGSSWNLLGQQGFPAITVPAGFTTEVFDRVRDPQAKDGTKLVGPVKAALPVGIDFLGRPFDEPLLFRIASAYEQATHHRHPPADFGALPGEP
jgi:amidase